MSFLPKIRTSYGEDIGVELYFGFPELQAEEKTYLDADAASGSSSLAANGSNFAVGQYILIGQPGNNRSEIVQIHASTAPTSVLITLAANTVFAHNRGDIVRFIPYNEIAAEFSTNGGINFSTITAVPIRADATETQMQRTSDASSTVYRFHFFNSTTGLYSAYSDTVLGSGYADNTIWAVKNRALNELGEERSQLINETFLNDSIQEGRRMADQNPAIFRWSFRTQFGVVIGQMLAGQWQVTLPSNLRDRNTNKNILSLRMGAQNRPITYQDRRRFNQNYLNVGHTTVAVQAIANATSLVLASTHDLDAAGSLQLANNNVGDGFIIITYTGNNLATNTLTGVTGINRTVLVGTDCWQRGVYGLQTGYTVDNGTVSFDVPLKVDYDGMDLKGDYYSIIPPISTDDQTFDEPFYDLYVSWLKWKIKYKKANGKIDRDGDADYKEWQSGLANLIAQEFPSQRVNFVPDVEGFLSASE